MGGPYQIAWLPPKTAGSVLVLAGPPFAPKWLPPGPTGSVLTMAPGSTPLWAPVAAASLITEPGDLIVGDELGEAARLPRGAPDELLAVDASGVLAWVPAPSSLPPGTNGHWLTLAAGAPTWAALPVDPGFANPMTAPADLIVGGASGAPTRLAGGANTQVLTVVGGALVWAAPASGGMANPMTAPGDLIRGGVAGAAERVAVGTAGHVLTVVGGVPAWSALPVDPGFANPMTTVADLIVGGVAGAPARLGVGGNGTVLTVVAGALAWAALPADVGFANPMTTPGDLMRGGTAGAATRLGIGSNGQVLTVTGGALTWGNPALLDTLMTAGSILFAGAAGLLTQDNANLFWDDAGNNLRLFGAPSVGTSGAKVLALGAGTAPTTAPADTVQRWTADISGAGTAGPRFMLETAQALDEIGVLNRTAGNGFALVLNSAAEVSFLSFLLKGNTLLLKRAMRWWMGLQIGNSSGSTQSLVIRVKYGGVTQITFTTGWATSATNYHLLFEGVFGGLGEASTLKMVAWSFAALKTDGTSSGGTVQQAYRHVTVNAAIDQTFEITCQWGVAHGSLWAQGDYFYAELL